MRGGGYPGRPVSKNDERRTMEVHKLFTDDRAVSPVVGVALLIAVAVILAAVIGAVVLGLGTGGVETPQAQLQGDYNGTHWTISHNGGEPIPADHVEFVDSSGTNVNDATFDGDELSTGESYTFAANETEVSLIWDDPNSDSETVLEEFSD